MAQSPDQRADDPKRSASDETPEASDSFYGLDGGDISKLVPGAKSHFKGAIASYSQQLFNEAKGIEQLEHTGSGPTEINAAHVEEAKWVLLRRARRQAKHSGWVGTLRVGQVVSSAALGIGASNFSHDWGAITCIIAVLFGSLLLLVERELSREA
jgi:hypothetical protein